MTNQADILGRAPMRKEYNPSGPSPSDLPPFSELCEALSAKIRSPRSHAWTDGSFQAVKDGHHPKGRVAMYESAAKVEAPQPPASPSKPKTGQSTGSRKRLREWVPKQKGSFVMSQAVADLGISKRSSDAFRALEREGLIERIGRQEKEILWKAVKA